MANPVTPTKNGNRYRFAWGDVVLEIDAAAGARVATLSLGGADLIVPVSDANELTACGSVSWTSRARMDTTTLATTNDDRQRDVPTRTSPRTAWGVTTNT